MSLYYCLVPKMANAVVLWVIVYFCVTSVNTKDTVNSDTQEHNTRQNISYILINVPPTNNISARVWNVL